MASQYDEVVALQTRALGIMGVTKAVITWKNAWNNSDTRCPWVGDVVLTCENAYSNSPLVIRGIQLKR